MQSKAHTVDEYLAGQPEPRRGELAQIRAMIRKVASKVVESMQYGMPTYTHANGEMFCAFNAQKNYLALYSEAAAEAVRAKLPKLKIGKSCIRFRSLAEAPLDVLAAGLRAAAVPHA